VCSGLVCMVFGNSWFSGFGVLGFMDGLLSVLMGLVMGFSGVCCVFVRIPDSAELAGLER
ncbi:MAG: hypothetical protein J7L82_05945, partial [Staphylothermus sp.]|nr:hypothetical protein [Staphylothermus sp.]